MYFKELSDKWLLKLEYRRNRHKHDHYLPCFKSSAHKHMPEPALTASLIKDLYFKVPEHIAHGQNNSVGRFIVNEAFIDVNDFMCSRFIYDGNHPASFSKTECRMNLIAVMQRFVHADDILHMPEPAECFNGKALLMIQLLLIASFLKLTSAAVFIIRARCVFFHGCLCHSLPPCLSCNHFIIVLPFAVSVINHKRYISHYP